MAGTDKTKGVADGRARRSMLVEPQLGENIGMVARAMANFGLSELRLVNPRDGWPSEKARVGSGARPTTSSMRQLRSSRRLRRRLPISISSMRQRRRERDGFKPVRGPVEAAETLRQRHRGRNKTCGVLFGRERWGLNNEEVGLADEIVTYPD